MRLRLYFQGKLKIRSREDKTKIKGKIKIRQNYWKKIDRLRHSVVKFWAVFIKRYNTGFMMAKTVYFIKKGN